MNLGAKKQSISSDLHISPFLCIKYAVTEWPRTLQVAWRHQGFSQKNFKCYLGRRKRQWFRYNNAAGQRLQGDKCYWNLEFFPYCFMKDFWICSSLQTSKLEIIYWIVFQYPIFGLRTSSDNSKREGRLIFKTSTLMLETELSRASESSMFSNNQAIKNVALMSNSTASIACI